MSSQPSDGPPTQLTFLQRKVVSYPREGGGRLFLRGLPGTGRSTALMARLAALLREGRRPYEILVLVPQRAQGERYERAIAELGGPTRGGVDIVTFYGLARRAVALFWPLIAPLAGLAHPDREPTFLTIETTQYFMWRIVEPLIAEEGYFSDLAIRRGRLLSQLIDNLNKSALVGFDHTDILPRLRAAWTGSADHINSYWQAQDCAIRFREYCLAHGLLDFSLAMEVYHRYLLSHEVYRRYFRARYRHLLVDNLEENVPIAHDMIDWAMGHCESSVLACDTGGGYRIFLGADYQGALELGGRCTEMVTFDELLEPTAEMLAFSDGLRRALRLQSPSASPDGAPGRAVIAQGPGEDRGRYWISMIRWVADHIAELADEGTLASEIAIVAPYVSELMRFSIEEELSKRDIALHLLRPSTPLRDEPVIRALLVLSVLGHPQWQIVIQGERYVLPIEDAALGLQMALADLDPIRARHLAGAAMPRGESCLADLSGVTQGGAGQRDLGRLWEHVGYQVRQRYETLRVWLETYHQGEPEPVDIFLSRLFGELLSRPGYGFYDQPERARAYGRLVESAAKFRAAVSLDETLDEREVAREYVHLIMGGIASAEYLVDWPRPARTEAVTLAPAYAYLTRDLRSTYQFWIDLGSDGWWNRPNQPLTHPYVLSRRWPNVLSRRWPMGQPWRDIEEDQAKREALGRVVQGLAARCTGGIFLAYSDLGIDGVERRSRLQRAIMTAMSGVVRNG